MSFRTSFRRRAAGNGMTVGHVGHLLRGLDDASLFFVFLILTICHTHIYIYIYIYLYIVYKSKTC